jgi:hypothetical protein
LGINKDINANKNADYWRSIIAVYYREWKSISPGDLMSYDKVLSSGDLMTGNKKYITL